jgi:hypothetical protein
MGMGNEARANPESGPVVMTVGWWRDSESLNDSDQDGIIDGKDLSPCDPNNPALTATAAALQPTATIAPPTLAPTQPPPTAPPTLAPTQPPPTAAPTPQPTRFPAFGDYPGVDRN